MVSLAPLNQREPPGDTAAWQLVSTPAQMALAALLPNRPRLAPCPSNEDQSMYWWLVMPIAALAEPVPAGMPKRAAVLGSGSTGKAPTVVVRSVTGSKAAAETPDTGSGWGTTN